MTEQEAPRSFTEAFERDCPYYMAIGMTYEQYWYGDVWIVRSFLEADRRRQERMNQEAWLQGMYFWDALTSAFKNAFSPKGTRPEKYPEKPYEFSCRSKEEEKQDPEEQERLKAKLYMKQMEWESKGWGRRKGIPNP